jgi:hypothetical protein
MAHDPDAAELARALTSDLDTADAFALDRRLRVAMRALRTIDPRMGTLLNALRRSIVRLLDHPTMSDYVRERLGMSSRKAQALLRLERVCWRAPVFAAAYRSGALSWVRALTVLPMIERDHEAAWVARAQAVTVRRLAAEVDWALDLRDASGGRAGWEPPPKGTPLSGDDRSQGSSASCAPTNPAGGMGSPQIGAEERVTNCVDAGAATDFVTAETGGWAACLSDGEVRFVGPASVVAMFRCAVRAHAQPGEPRWRALDRLLVATVAEWTAQPRHRDPIFARDGWRCTVPACSSRGPLHDHHLLFRSRGGSNDRSNRTSICVPHHQYGIHAERVRAWGEAPSAVHWQLGLRQGSPPLMELVGDVYVAGAV